MPPVTPSSTRRPARGELLDALAEALRALEADLAFRDLLEGDGEGLVLQAAGLDQRRDELAPPLAELAVVRVDLPGPLGGQDHQRVLGIDRGQQVVDLRFDHGCTSFSGGLLRYRSIIRATSAAARSSSSFT